MVKYPYIILSLLGLLLLFTGCEQAKKKEVKEKKTLEGLVQHHRSDGSLASEVQYKSKKKHGLAKGYYKDGTLKSEIHYQEDIREGTAKVYYENGKLYRETPFEQDKKNGIQKVYRENGRLLAEIPYKMDFLGTRTVEYTPEGKPKKQLPEIQVEHINNLLKNNQYIVRISLSRGYKNVDYYIGELTEGKYKNNNLMRMVGTNGILELKYTLPAGAYMMETVHLVAETKTQMRNPYLLYKKINIAAENTGF
jgi:hypothetical protein